MDIVANRARNEVWQEYEKPHGKKHAKHHRKRHKHVHRIDFEFVRHPFFKLGRLGVIAVNFRRAHHYARTLEKLREKIDHASYKRQAEKHVALFGAFDVLALDGYITARSAYGSCDGVFALHHNAFEHGLSADTRPPHRF